MKKSNYFTTCKNLIWSDLIILKQNIVDKIIDVSIWVILQIITTKYVMPFFGLMNFGLFQFAGIIASIGLFELYSSVIDFVTDLEGDRIINYNLTLPIPAILVLISKSIYYFIMYSALTLAMLPIGYLCLWNQLSLMHICYYKLILSIVLQNIFFACFTIWTSSMIDNILKLGQTWSRFIFPMWFMGGFNFSWLSLYSTTPVLAYLNVINPMIYITESIRGALLGQTGYANFWLCLATTAVFSVLCFAIGISKLKKRLDFV